MVRWTFVLIGVCVVVFLLQQTDIFDWQLFEFTPALALQRPWTFVTSIFLHADFSHIFFNMFALFMFGIILENRIGPSHFLILFFLSGIAGSIGYMISASGSMIPAIGASGAIYGIIGTLAVLMPLMTVWFWGGIPMPMIVLAVIWIALEVFGLFYPSNIAHGAHLGGVVVGILYGAYLRMKERKTVRTFFRKEEFRY